MHSPTRPARSRTSQAPDRARRALVAALAIVATLAPPLRAQQGTDVEIRDGVADGGMATPLWREMLRRRMSTSDADSFAALRRPLAPDERAWARLVRDRARVWSGEVPSVASVFAPIAAPRVIRLVLGNRGGGDAFTHDSTTLGFDLSELRRLYGPAEDTTNAARVDRFFRHETMHAMQKRWLARHPWNADTPLARALLDIWSEGLGNFYSLSEKWRNGQGALTPAADAALANLTPTLIERLARMACADSVAAAPLLVGLSSGPFDRKWGALPAALWLEAEVARDPGALRAFATDGPAAVWSLASRHLSTTLADSLARVRARAARCAS